MNGPKDEWPPDDEWIAHAWRVIDGMRGRPTDDHASATTNEDARILMADLKRLIALAGDETGRAIDNERFIRELGDMADACRELIT